MSFDSIDGIDVSLHDHLLRIRLNRPHAHNAMTPDQMNHVSKLCTQAEADDDVRVVLLTGTGESFCAGADLSGVDLSAGGGQIPPVSMSKNLFIALLDLSKPLVGAINGVAAGGGLGLALCCDIRLGSDAARFATSFSRIGLTANDAVAWLLPRIVGIAKAIELIAVPTPIDAIEAERIGLISYRYPVDEFEARVDQFVGTLLAAPPVGMRFSKRLVIDGLDRSYREHVLAQEYATLANRTIANHDIEEGVAAFKEKRKPDFQGNLMKPVWENY